MAARQDTMKLGAMLSASGSHIAAWRHPGAQADGGTNFARHVELARRCEAACLDFIFLADNLAHQPLPRDVLSHTASYIGNMEPITLLSALAAVTERVGLVATASTTYNEPFHIARKFGTLDHISEGRAGWNLVTSSNDAEAHNFGRDSHLVHAERYVRAEEFFDVVAGLWDSFADDAFIRDKAAGVYFDPDKLRPLDHAGELLRVKGPLNLGRPPQGRPVVFQAGSSDAGIALAARTAEAIFTAQPTVATAQAFYTKIKDAAESFGRSRDAIKVMPGLFAIVGDNEAQAREKHEELQELVHPALGLALMQRAIGGGLDLSQYPLDGPVPELPATDSSRGRQEAMLEIARREGLTLRQLTLRFAGGFGNRQMIGTASQIADEMQELFEAEGADGFILAAPWLPGGLTEILDTVVPLLARRGLFRSSYEGKTLRDHLGLERPARAEKAHS